MHYLFHLSGPVCQFYNCLSFIYILYIFIVWFIVEYYYLDLERSELRNTRLVNKVKRYRTIVEVEGLKEGASATHTVLNVM